MDVLLVEDVSDLRMMLRWYMETKQDMRVVGEADAGDVALRLAEALHPDVIVLDRRLETMSGDAALPLLREVAPEAAVVVYSSFVDDRTVSRQLIGLGADAVVDKAVSVTKLEAAIRWSLTQHHSGRGR